MITLLIILLVVIGVFLVALLSPPYGSAAQRLSRRLLQQIQSAIRNWPKWLRTVVGTPPELSQKAIHKSAAAGKKSRRKLNR